MTETGLRNRDEIADLIRREAQILTAPLTPELRYWGVDQATPLWEATEAALDAIQLPPPFWAFAWPGGQALARLLLDEPERARGKRVLALAAGGGLEAVAAALAQAAVVIANDVDPIACVAAEMNADLNGVGIEVDDRDLLDAGLIVHRSEQNEAAPKDVELFADLVLIGDAFYETSLNARLIAAINAATAAGVEVLIGDAGRADAASAAFLDQLEVVAAFDAPTLESLEDATARRTRVLRRAATS